MDQLREIPFVKVEYANFFGHTNYKNKHLENIYLNKRTSAPPYRISPHQNKRRYSPRRRKSSEMQDSKIAYIRDGTSQVVKTVPVTSSLT